MDGGKARNFRLFFWLLPVIVWLNLSLIFQPFGMPMFVLAQPPIATPHNPPPVESQDNGLPPPSNSESSTVAGVTDTWFKMVKQQILQEQLILTPAGDTGVDGFNAFQDFQFSVSNEGLAISRRNLPQINTPKTPTQMNLPVWQLNLSLDGIGYRNYIQPVLTAGKPVVLATRAEINHINFTEWYENNENGLEHGFTLPAPPAQRPADDPPLVLQLNITTGLIPQLNPNGRTLDFSLPDGNVTVLRYADLYVIDANGQELPAYFELQAGLKLLILIDDSTATYPLTIDPLITTPEWTATGENSWDYFGIALATAGDVNGDGFDDVIISATGNNSYTGKAYVYYGSFKGLSSTPDWTATGENSGDYFGGAVGTAGDVNGDGFDDVIISAARNNSYTGKAYVYYGSPSGLSPTPDWTATGEAVLENQARDAQRTFDENASDMATELDNLQVELDNQLFELCGKTQDDYATCTGGLMAQNLQEMYAASKRVGLAWLRAQNAAKEIQNEQDRAAEVIQVTLELGNTIAANELAIGVLEAYQETRSFVKSSENQINLGVEASLKVFWGIEVESTVSANPIHFGSKWTSKAGLEASITAQAGYNHAWTWNNATTETWNPNAEEISRYRSQSEVQQFIAQSKIEGANSAAVIKNLLLQESEALQEYEIAMAEFNQLSVEHNYLGEQYSRLLNRRANAINRVANHNSHLLNPAYRIWRDSLTTQSLAAHNLAAQFAYLTARAAEYELLTPYPNLDDIFKARTSNDIRLFLDNLKVWYQALNLPGQLNRYPYTISFAQDICGLTDEALDPKSTLSPSELAQKRFDEFQSCLQKYISRNQLTIDFSTSLEQQHSQNQFLFSPNIWNNRIAGIGAPLKDNQGVWINLVTKQTVVSGNPEIILVHGSSAGGAETYRNAAGSIVRYDPATAVPVGYVVPPELAPGNTTIVLRPGINGSGEIPNGGLVGLSVASTSWQLIIPADSRGNLDYSQLQDIEIHMDSSGRAIPGREAQAISDARALAETGQLAALTAVQMHRIFETDFSSNALAITRSRALNEAIASPPTVPSTLGGRYYGAIAITAPITVGIQLLNLDLWNTGGVITGNVNIAETSSYTIPVAVNGVVAGGIFTLTSDVFTNTIAGWHVTQIFTLTGQVLENGDLLQANYLAMVNNLLPETTIVAGQFSASRPVTPGSPRLILTVSPGIVAAFSTTIITATLQNSAMRIIAPNQPITFTTNVGTIVPVSAVPVNGMVSAALTVGSVPGGEIIISATDGQITETLTIGVSNATGYDVYLPLIFNSTKSYSYYLPLIFR